MGGSEPPSTTHDAGAGDASLLTGVSERFGLAGGPWAAWQEEELASGTDLGGVVIVRLLARGGMGAVYEARQVSPPRSVAVKVVREFLLGAATLRRFEDEARALARLRHPHVAQIHTVGSFASARGPVPFIVMELVEGGRAITEHAAVLALPIRDRVTLFLKACAAVAHGHRQGVIHRDVKPGNVLVSSNGEPKVIDFGVARTLDPGATTAGAATATGDLVGTLRYMSPEQLGADPDAVDTRTDVYSLGLVLHEIVTGSLPYDLQGKSPLEAARILDGRTAPTLAAVERAVRAEGRAHAADGRSLAAIVARCLEPRPAERYSTAAELEADLGRWLAGEPVLARPPGTLETILRLARRHRAAVVAACGTLAAVVLAVVGIAVFSIRAESQRRLAVEARAVAEERKREADRQAAEARAELYVSSVLLAAEARDRDNLAEAGRLLAAARGLVDKAHARPPLELDCLAASLDESMAVIHGHRDTVTAVAWSPDGRRLASGGADGTVRMGSAPPAGDEPLVLAGHEKEIWGVAFAPDGGMLATASADGTVRLWETASGRAIAVLDAHDGPVYAAAFSLDGGLLATASRDRTVRLWETDTWRERSVLRGHEGTVHAVAFSSAGDRLVTASQDKTARLWDVATGTEQAVFAGHDERLFSVALSPDGHRVATASQDGTVRIWDVTTGTESARLAHPFRVNAVAFVEDGGRVATASGDGLLRVWDVETGRETARLRGHAGHLWSLAVEAGGPRAATGSADGTVRIWDLDGREAPVVRGVERMLAVAVAPDGGEIALGTATGGVQLCDAATLMPRSTLEAGTGRVNAVAYAADGQTLAAAGDDGRVRLWPCASPREPEVIPAHERRVYSVAFSVLGGRLATASEDRTVRIWDPATRTEVCGPLRHPRRAFCAAFAPDGRSIATACEDGIARLWDVATGLETARCEGHEAAVNWLAFAPDGGRLATASSDGTVRLWSVPECRSLAVLTGPARQVWKVAFAPDGMRVAAVSADGTGQLWDAASGRAVATLRGHGDQVWGVAFPPDGRSLFTVSWDGTARLWGVSAAEIARRRAAAPH